MSKSKLSRRQFIRTGATAAAGLVISACVPDVPSEESQASETQPEPTKSEEVIETGATVQHTPAATAAEASIDVPTLEPTPQCDHHDETRAQGEGPFYTPDTPQRTSLVESGMSGAVLVVTGRVLTTRCEPIAGAVLDFWHADTLGEYDNIGYLFRGHQFSNEDGSYRLETLLPGLYTGRTRHIHVKVQGLNTRLLTTQMYFPDEAANESDGIFHPALIMNVEEGVAGLDASFDFVLAA